MRRSLAAGHIHNDVIIVYFYSTGKMAAPKHFLLTGVICSILATYVDSGSEDARIGTVRQISAVELDSIVGSTEDVLAFFCKYYNL